MNMTDEKEEEGMTRIWEKNIKKTRNKKKTRRCSSGITYSKIGAGNETKREQNQADG
jgi:hypothetical protein